MKLSIPYISHFHHFLTYAWRKGKVFAVHTMKAYRGREVQLHSFLSSVLNEGERLTSLPCRFNPVNTMVPLNRGLGGPRSRSGRFEKRKKSVVSTWIWIPVHPACTLVAMKYAPNPSTRTCCLQTWLCAQISLNQPKICSIFRWGSVRPSCSTALADRR